MDFGQKLSKYLPGGNLKENFVGANGRKFGRNVGRAPDVHLALVLTYCFISEDSIELQQITVRERGRGGNGTTLDFPGSYCMNLKELNSS